MTNSQRANMFYLAVQHFLHNGNFKIDEGDIEHAIESDSSEEISEAYNYVNGPNSTGLQNRIALIVQEITEQLADESEHFAAHYDPATGAHEGEEEQTEEERWGGAPITNGHGGMPESPYTKNGGSPYGDDTKSSDFWEGYDFGEGRNPDDPTYA